MEQDLTTVLRSELFSGVSEDEAGRMLGCLGSRRASYGRGEYLLRAGEPPRGIGLVLAGSVLIIREDFWGNRDILAKLGPGQLFAEAFACANAALTVSAVAETPAEALFLDAARVLHTCPAACAYHARLVRNIVAVLAEKNLRLNEKLAHTGKRATRDKLLSYLSAEARRAGAPDFEIPFSRQQLADYLSVDRSAMSAALSRLRDEGVLRFSRCHFELLGGADTDL